VKPRTKLFASALCAAAALLLAALPASAYATFPATTNPSGSASAPFPAGAAQYLTLRVPEERPGPPKADNVDVRVELPAGWTGAICDDARTASGADVGPAAAGWSCTVEPGTPTVVHWVRAAGATGDGVFFPYTVMTPSAAGTAAFVVHQTYSTGEVVDWEDPAVPPGCATGTNAAGTACNNPAPTRAVGAAARHGFWAVASDGGVFSFGDAAFLGSTGGMALNKPIVGMAATPSGNGYWLVASDGGIFTFGDAAFLGSTGDKVLNKPIVGMGATPSGNGYWLVASDGGMFSFGDATFFGSTGDKVLNKPIVGMASSPSGRGYWLVASDGGIFTFGDAGFFGSTGDLALNRPITSMTATPSGKGYWLVASDGGIFTFGNAPFVGSSGGTGGGLCVGASLTPTGAGYWLTTAGGRVDA
jgi:hypothetical protein